MSAWDWAVLASWLSFTILYGLYRSRGKQTTQSYLLAGKSMPWYAMGLSIMATQASAITFISTTGQAYVDGMRFVQFYFGLPLAMIILSMTAVPLFHRANVYTAYEFLEQRFDRRTRILVSIVFLIQRGLGAGLALYAPAVVLSVVLGWPEQVTTLFMGLLVIAYTTLGGVKAVTWSDVQQMLLIFAGLILALVLAVVRLPEEIGLLDAVALAGAAGRLNAVVTKFDWNDRYNLWSGLFGGMFLALAYFGTDQSQVQRYLTGRSIAQSRLSLLFNAMAKIPMQFFILFIGTMVFVFFVFERPPLLFQPADLKNLEREPAYSSVVRRFDEAHQVRRESARAYLEARKRHDPAGQTKALRTYRQAQASLDQARAEAARLLGAGPDTNYIFLNFVIRYMPVGVVGLIVAVIFAAAMSTISGEVNSLATVTVMDVYRPLVKSGATDSHYLWASRGATIFWGLYAVAFAGFGGRLGSLIEAVNIVGSLFYGGMLGVFVLAFFFRFVGAQGAFWGVLAGEAAIFYCWRFTSISFLWYNVIGCLVVIAVGCLLSLTRLRRSSAV
ncbi:MAG: sodium:solute symporter [Bryobacteraceae bacterium]|nr:sodium:solute symporter [Bryobacteraceae bacterium]MDW8378707.1 sodium:solute symporter [Bryobacterales bacterium]